MLGQMEQWKWAGEKMRTMWRGEVVSILSLIFTLALLISLAAMVLFYPTLLSGGGLFFTAFLLLIGGAAMLIGGIVYLVGLYGLREIQPEYNTAFQCSLAGIILSVIAEIAGEGSIIYTVLDTANTVLSLVTIWLVLQATNRIMTELGREDLARRGRTVWMLNLLSAVGTALVLLFPSEELIESAWMLGFTIVMLILSIVATFFYLRYLSQSASAMLEYAW